MSEPLFAVLFTATLLSAHTVEVSNSDRIASWTGCLAALAFLTRSAGIVLLFAIPVAFGIQRRFGAAWRFLMCGGAFACVWPIWVHTRASAVKEIELYYSSANYSSWNILINYTLREKLHILLGNILSALASPLVLLELPVSMLLVALTFLTVVIIFAKKLVRADAIHCSIAGYIGMVLCWAWPTPRFIMVILPILLLLIWKAIESSMRNCTGRRLLAVSVTVLCCVLVVKDVRCIPETTKSGQFPIGLKAADEWDEMKKVFLSVIANTPQDTVVLANLDPVIYLYTGRKSIRSFTANAYKLFYAPGAPTQDSITSLDQIIEKTDASVVVMTPDRWFSESPMLQSELARYMRRYPLRLQTIDYSGLNPEYQIYRVHRRSKPSVRSVSPVISVRSGS